VDVSPHISSILSGYGVASISRIDKIIGLFCRIASLLWGSFAKETYNFIDPTNISHPIVCGERRARKNMVYVCMSSRMFERDTEREVAGKGRQGREKDNRERRERSSIGVREREREREREKTRDRETKSVKE